MLGKKELCKQLEELATRLGAKLIYDELTFPGGHCRSEGQCYIIINERLALDEKIRLLCAGISELPWEQESLPAEVQNLLIRKQPRNRDPESGIGDQESGIGVRGSGFGPNPESRTPKPGSADPNPVAEVVPKGPPQDRSPE